MAPWCHTMACPQVWGLPHSASVPVTSPPPPPLPGLPATGAGDSRSHQCRHHHLPGGGGGGGNIGLHCATAGRDNLWPQPGAAVMWWHRCHCHQEPAGTLGGGGGPPWGHHAVPRGVTQKPGDPTPGNTPVVWPLPPPPTCSRGSPCATPPFVPHLGAPIFWGAGAQLSCPPPMCAAPQGREHFIFVFKVYFVILGWWERVEFGDRDVPPPWL